MRFPIVHFGLPALLTLAAIGNCAASEKVLPEDSRKPSLHVWVGSRPTVDGVIAPGEYVDASSIESVGQWVAQFSPTRNASDLALRGYAKHDGEQLYFAFEITDDMLYGIDTPRWLPPNNPHAHELSPRGYPWFGDEMEILLNATNLWNGDESVSGSGASWQMVCNLTKSRLGGVGTGGLLEGEPRSSENAWNTYQQWIREGAQTCSAKPKPSGKGYIIEWAIRFRPCVELAPGEFWNPSSGVHHVGLNLALGDLDLPENGTGNFGNFHHEDWWAGATNVRTRLRHFGVLVLHPGQRP